MAIKCFGVICMANAFKEVWDEKFGNNLYRLRIERGMSREETAKRLHISPRTLKRLEEGYIGPRLSATVVLYAAETFQVAVSEIFGEI